MKARAHYLLREEDDDQVAWEMAAASGAPFDPRDSGKISAWLRLSASTISSGEYDTVVDVLNSNPTSQADTDRKPAATTAANGLPVMQFDGSDVLAWPLIAANNSTTKIGWAFWYNPASVAAVTQELLCVFDGTGGASARKLLFYQFGSAINAAAYINATDGRNGATASSVVAVGTWVWMRLAYDSSLGGDTNLKIYLNGSSQSLTYSNVGAGGTLTTLPSVTGNALIGSLANTDAGSGPLLNGALIGPNVFVLNADLTAAEEASLMNFEKPT